MLITSRSRDIRGIFMIGGIMGRNTGNQLISRKSYLFNLLLRPLNSELTIDFRKVWLDNFARPSKNIYSSLRFQISLKLNMCFRRIHHVYLCSGTNGSCGMWRLELGPTASWFEAQLSRKLRTFHTARNQQSFSWRKIRTVVRPVIKSTCGSPNGQKKQHAFVYLYGCPFAWC